MFALFVHPNERIKKHPVMKKFIAGCPFLLTTKGVAITSCWPCWARGRVPERGLRWEQLPVPKVHRRSRMIHRKNRKKNHKPTDSYRSFESSIA